MRVSGISQGVRPLTPKTSQKPLAKSVSFSGLSPKLAEVPLGKVVSVGVRNIDASQLDTIVGLFVDIAHRHKCAMLIEEMGHHNFGFGKHIRVSTNLSDGKVGPRLYMGYTRGMYNCHVYHYDQKTLKGYSKDDILGFFDDALAGKKSFPNTATTGIIMSDEVSSFTKAAVMPRIEPQEWKFGEFKWRQDEQTQKHLRYIRKVRTVMSEINHYSDLLCPEVFLLQQFAIKSGVAGLIACVRHPAYGHSLQYITKLPTDELKSSADRLFLTTGPLGLHSDFSLFRYDGRYHRGQSSACLRDKYMNKANERIGSRSFSDGDSQQELGY